MEIIIGREEGLRRLHCIADGREFNIGQAGTVPNSVSRKHCRITVVGERITISNIKDQNVTYVDGNQIFCKDITATSRVQLGSEQYTIPLQQILQLAIGKPVGNSAAAVGAQQSQVPTYSLLPMKAVWDEYAKKKLEIQEEAAKKANQSRLQGIVSMFGVALGLLPIPIIFRAICVIGALCLAIYFFMSGKNSDSVQKQLFDLEEEYSHKYKCPNPKCGKPFGNAPYHSIEFNKQCFACGCKYTH